MTLREWAARWLRPPLAALVSPPPTAPSCSIEPGGVTAYPLIQRQVPGWHPVTVPDTPETLAAIERYNQAKAAAARRASGLEMG